MYTWMHAVKNIRENIKYPITDKENQAQRGERIEGVIFGGGLIDTGSADSIAEQFEYYLHRAGRRYRENIHGEYPIQGWTKTISFSENEIAKDDPEGADKALELTKRVQDNLAPDCMWMAVAQRDGKGGYWHVHIVQSAVHNSTLKACAGRETRSDIFAEIVDETAEKMGYTLDYGKDHSKREKKKAKAKQRHEKAKQEDGYSWMIDLQARVSRAVLATTSADDYEANLEANGVKVTRKTKSGWTYVLAECVNEQFIGKKARYDKFSVDLKQTTLNKKFRMNYRDVIAKGLDPRTGARKLPDISGITGTKGHDFEHNGY